MSTSQIRETIDTLQMNWDWLRGDTTNWFSIQLTKSISSRTHCKNSTIEKRFCDNFIMISDHCQLFFNFNNTWTWINLCILIHFNRAKNWKCSAVSWTFCWSRQYWHLQSTHTFAHHHAKGIQNRLFLRFAAARHSSLGNILTAQKSGSLFGVNVTFDIYFLYRFSLFRWNGITASLSHTHTFITLRSGSVCRHKHKWVAPNRIFIEQNLIFE